MVILFKLTKYFNGFSFIVNPDLKPKQNCDQIFKRIDKKKIAYFQCNINAFKCKCTA